MGSGRPITGKIEQSTGAVFFVQKLTHILNGEPEKALYKL